MVDTTSPETLNARDSNEAVYERSLRDKDSTIRLLHASRNALSEVIWKLEEHDLESLPYYTALSYCWGREDLPNLITLNAIRFRVMDSVFAILEAIRTNPDFSSSSKSDSWWWIDSICINQKNSLERASQVELMGQIYKYSHRTVGWLGAGSGNTELEEDLEFTRRGEKTIDSLLLLRKYRDSIVEGEEKDRKAAMKSISPRVAWTEVEELLSRPWWRRVRTLQEYFIPSEFQFWCGTRQISKKKLKVATYAIYKILHTPEYSNVISRHAWLPIWNRRRVFMWHTEIGDQLPLLALIAHGGDCKASNPKDRIFSVLGLTNRGLDKDLTAPNYNQEVNAGDVFRRFVEEFLEKHQSLDILCFTHVFNQKQKPSELVHELPSWVPDWIVEVPSYVIPVMASQSNNPALEISDQLIEWTT